ncbi:MAG: RloB family protein [Oscillospiraceae bacterium]|nr:RloB family protein [Oscillospiraceae bacterium]
MSKRQIIRRQYFCICEGQQEKIYLSHLSSLLKTDVRQITFKTKEGQAKKIQSHRHIKYDKAILFDYDGNSIEFERALHECRKASCMHAYSNLNFDLWLLLHKKDFSSSVTNNNDYINEIRSTYKLKSDADIKNYKEVTRIVEQISLCDVKDAIKRAKQIREHKLPNDGHKIHGVTYYGNPDLSIHEFIMRVFKECGESAA